MLLILERRFRAALKSSAGGVRLDPVAVAAAMEAPFLQIQRCDYFLHLVKSSPVI